MHLQIHLTSNDHQPIQTPSKPSLPAPTTKSQHHHNRHPTFLFPTHSKPSLFVFLLLLLSLLLSPLTTAQEPSPRRRTAYAQTPNNTRLYIQGGLPIGTGYTPEFNELDLTKPWSTSSPAWTLLPPGLPNYHHVLVYVKPEHSAGLGGAGAGSQGYLFSIGGNTVPSVNFWAYYNIQTRQWTPLTSPPAPYTGLEGQTAVSDPNTGLIYVIGGFWNLDGKLPTTIMINNFLTVIDPTQSTGTRIVSQTAATGMNNLTGAVAVWSTMRRSVLVFGGSRAVSLANVAGLGMTSVDEYDPVHGVWGIMRTSGSSVPGGRLDACAAATDDGSKIIIFGGELNVQSFLSSIYVLDVATQVWKRGPDVATPRSQSACAYHDGYFVVFGGTGSRNMSEDMHTTQPLVFNVETLLWVLQFTPKEAPPGNGSSGDSTGDDGAGRNRGKSNIGLIVACAFGGFVVLLGIMIAVILNRKAHHRRRRDIFKTATDKHTRRSDGTTVIPREAAAFIHHSGGGAGAGGRRSGVNDGDDDEHDYPPFHRSRNPPTNNHPYKPFTPTEFYPSAYGNKPTTAAAAAAAATAPKVSTPTTYYPTAFGHIPIIATETSSTTKGVPLMAAAVATSSRPVSSSSRPASFTTTAAQSVPSSYYKAIQGEMDKPQPKPPSPLPSTAPRTSAFAPSTSYTPSSPTYSDQMDSTILGYMSTMISPPVRPNVGLPPPIPRRPPSGAGYYATASVGDAGAPVIAVSANQQQQRQQRSPSPPAQAPQYRGDEHAQYQAQFYQSQQQRQYPYCSQHQHQEAYQQPNPSQGYIQEQHQHSTSRSTATEEAEKQSPHPSIDGYKEFHGAWMNDRRRYVAPHAVREVPVEKYRDYKVEAPRRPQMDQGSFH